MPLEAATSFQESGIFDTSCELVHVTTQTDLVSENVQPCVRHDAPCLRLCVRMLDLSAAAGSPTEPFSYVVTDLKSFGRESVQFLR